MKNVKKMMQAGLKKFTVITILGVFLMTSLIPVSAATKVSKIKWSAYRKTMYVGNAQRFAVKITPTKASKAKLGWKTSNKKIAKVSTKGVVTPVKAGKATITCYVKSKKSKKVTCKVTVKETESDSNHICKSKRSRTERENGQQSSNRNTNLRSK